MSPRRTLTIARRVVRQLIRDRRLLALSVVAPLVIIYMLNIFFDTMPPGFAVARYAMPVAAFLVHFLAFLLCALVLVQERTAGTLERMFINGFGRAESGSGGPMPAPNAGAPSSGSGSGGASPTPPSTPKAQDHSETTSQVAGVDEADFVKADNEKIYLLHGTQLKVLRAWPKENLAAYRKASP